MALEHDARSRAQAGETRALGTSILDLTLKRCFKNPFTRETGVTRYKVIEQVQMWMWSDEIIKAERGFDEYVRTGRLVKVGQSRGGEEFYKLAEHLDSPQGDESATRA